MTAPDGFEHARPGEQEYRETWTALSAAERALVVTHANPDADAVASLLVTANLLGRTGAAVIAAVGDGELPENLRFLPGVGRLTPLNKLSIEGVDLVVMVDCADRHRAGPIFEQHQDWFDGHLPLANIDHHVTNARFGATNLVDPISAATCEVLARLIDIVGIAVDAADATCLFTGIQGDTLGLRTPSTTSATLRVSANLLDAGADLDTIVDNLYRVKPFTTVKLWGEILATAKMEGPLVWAQVTPGALRRSGADQSEAEGIVNFIAGSRGALVGALLYQLHGGWRVSLRSIREDVDVSVLAARFGGGGHPRAAGCKLSGGDDARDAFLKDIGEQLSALPAVVP